MVRNSNPTVLCVRVLREAWLEVRSPCKKSQCAWLKVPQSPSQDLTNLSRPALYSSSGMVMAKWPPLSKDKWLTRWHVAGALIAVPLHRISFTIQITSAGFRRREREEIKCCSTAPHRVQVFFFEQLQLRHAITVTLVATEAADDLKCGDLKHEISLMGLVCIETKLLVVLLLMFRRLRWFVDLNQKKWSTKRLVNVEQQPGLDRPNHLPVLDALHEVAIYIHRWYKIKVTMR
ncbi:hypothetical protein Fmac_026426 [Flemingia macrophylla]|uniref:Uncharacterized protein n=1 Tax=Flemingia macrophylla TaxID=520843 RepID=A0ABD1LET9_9FABA